MGAVSGEDVARAAGVSRAAVSQILNGRGQRFAEATRDRVLAVARELEYEPSAAGRSLRRGASDIVVAVVPNTTFGAHLQDILDQLTADLAEHGLFLVARYSPAGDPSFDRFVAALRPAAVLPLAPLSEEHLAILGRRAAPVLDLRAPSGAGHDVIGRLQAEHLVERGHRRLAFAHLSDRRENPYGGARLAGVRTVCHEHGLPDPDVLTVPVEVGRAVEELRRLTTPVGIACYNDDVALALMAAARVMGADVPGRVALVGVDRIPLGQVASPTLTSVAHDPLDVAHRPRDHVLDAVGIDAPPRGPGPTYRVVPGGST